MGISQEELRLRKRLEALEHERELCEEKKIGLFRGVNKLKQELRDGMIDDQRFNEELAKLPKAPPQIITDCNEEIRAIETDAEAVKKQLDRLIERKRKERASAAVVIAVVVLLSVSALFITSRLTGFVTREEVDVYSQHIGVNFTQPQQYVLAINGTGELRSLGLSGRLIGNGTVKAYLVANGTRYLVLDTEEIMAGGRVSRGGLLSITGHAVSEIAGDMQNLTPQNETLNDVLNETLPEPLAENIKLANETTSDATAANFTSAINDTINATVNETGESLNQTGGNESSETNESAQLPAAAEKSIDLSLAYSQGSVFDSNDDGIELDTSAIDFTVKETSFSWPADSSKLCTRWVMRSLDNNTQGAVCYGSADCCAIVELSPEQTNWDDTFYAFVGKYGATRNNTVSAQVIFANYSLGPESVYSEIYYSNFSTLPAEFILPPAAESATNATNETLTVVEFDSVCTETCSLAGVSGLNLSEYALVIEVENATLVLDNATYTLANAVEADTEPPAITILLPKAIRYHELLQPNETRNTTILKLNYSVSEQVSWIGYSLSSNSNVTIFGNATIEAANGTNTLTVYANDSAGNIGQATVQFSVNFSTPQPVIVEPFVIIITSPEQNATYNHTDINLNFTISKPASVSYFLNLDNKTTATRNVMLASVEGKNRLLVIANDSSGGIASALVNFFVNTSNITEVNTTANITPQLKSLKKSFKLGEDAQLEFEYINDSVVNALAKRGKALKKAVVGKRIGKFETSDDNVSAKLRNSSGGEFAVLPVIEQVRQGKFSISVPAPRAMKPGLYTLDVVLTMGNRTYVQSQNFTWGVLAINTNKSVFLPNEDALVAMAVLNDEGHMVCDANVSLTITDPTGAAATLTTAAGQIAVSPECQVYGVTNLPDYYANYSVNGVGTYVMNLTAATANGLRTILDNFTVQSQVDFDIARTGPTRIWPFAPYNMSFAVKANRNYNGFVTEFVPESFNITPQQGLAVTATADAKALSWNVRLKKGDTVSLHYEFDAPDESPEFYLLGELGIGTWKEARQWQVASDAVSIADDFLTIVPTSIGIGQLVNISGRYDNAGSTTCNVNLSISESGTTVTSSSSTAVRLVDIFWGAPCDIEYVNLGIIQCNSWASANDNIPINFTVNGTTGGGGSKTYTTVKNAGCAGTLDATDTLTVNLPPDITPPNNSIIVPLRNANVSGDFVVNVSVNDSSDVFQVNLTVYNNTGNATRTLPMNISTGSYKSGYWNITFDSTTLRDARYNLSVNATDSAAALNKNISLNVSITIDNTKPNVSIVVPLNDTTAGITLLINASVNDSLSRVFNVTFRLTNSDGSALTSWLFATGNGSNSQGYWNATFDTTTVSEGTYNITVNATDFAGNQQLVNVSQIITPMTTCTNLGTQNKVYLLGADVYDYRTCFNVTADNVTLDCNGLTVEYANASSGYGVNISGFNNTVIKNCVFLQQNRSVQFNTSAIFALKSNNSIFLNNTINSTGNYSYGIVIVSSNFTNITNNQLNISGNFSYGIGMGMSGLNNITSNNVTTQGGSNGYGINLTRSILNLVLNNNIITRGKGNNAYGVFLTRSANNNTIANNTVNTTGNGISNYGIYLVSTGAGDTVFGNVVSGNTVTTNGTSSNYGISLDSFTVNNTVASNTIMTTGTANGNIGIYVASSFAGGNAVIGNIITTNGTTDNYGISVTGSNNNTVFNNTIRAGGSGANNYGIQLGLGIGGTVLGNVISENNITTNGTTDNYGIALKSATGTKIVNNTVANNTIRTGGSGANNYGIFLVNSIGILLSGNTISGNMVNTSGTSNNVGIVLQSTVDNNTISNNTITTSGSANSNLGLYLNTALGNVVINNIIITNGTLNNHGIQLITLTRNNTVANNTITTGGSANGNYGIILSTSSSGNIVSGNTVTTNGTGNNHGIALATTAHANSVLNNTLIVGGLGEANFGIYFEGIVTNTTVFGNNITTIANSTNANHGIVVENAIDNNNNSFAANTILITTNESFGILINQSNRTVFANNTITTTGNLSFAVQILDGSTSNNTIYNNIFNTTAWAVNVTDNRSVNNFSITAYSATNIVGGSLIGGNFYDNSTVGGKSAYSLTCIDGDSDSICDVQINHSNGGDNATDFYPLAAPDRTSPNASTVMPVQNANVSGSFLINASVNDSRSNVLVLNLTIYNSTGNATVPIAMNISSGFLYSGYWNVTFDSTTLRDGLYNLSINATDNATARNANMSANVSITIDNTKPNVSIVVPLNSTVSGTELLINASVNDSPSRVFNVTFRLVNSTNGTITDWIFATPGTGDIGQGYWNATFDTTTVLNIDYNITINTTDFAGNQQIINMSGIAVNNGGNHAPVVWNVTNGTVTLVDGGTTEFTVNFNATDEESSTDLNSATAKVNITLNGLQRYNDSGNCESSNSDANTKRYSCKVVFYYYDNASSLWTINASVQDNSAVLGWNDTYSAGRTDNGASQNVTVNSLSAFSIVSSSIAATTSANTQNVEMIFIVNNTGNFDFTLINLTPTDLNASLTDIFRLEGNFSINASASTADGFGRGLLNGTPTNFSDSLLGGQLSATLPHKIKGAEADFKANRTLYIYIDIPLNKGLSTGVTYNTSSSYPWQIVAGTPS